MQPLFVYLLVINCIAFLANGTDKLLATRQKRRIPERSLLGLALLGGSVGAGLAMLLFRHKTAKKSYLLLFFGIVVIQLIGLYFYFRN
ncbi:DUF1294 domain-containing protein [Flavobacterium sp. SM15]|uniref:DUF1294 domain-containing protein n=1 Tax=Flavobacterium sp. SM15 TaxID=2908005 RepID=UPI001EDB7C6E|nr:DUF1294 domain-containing protein [Flavobacterium sp. SM15]MCG2610383.1 DUF1294 domain-containing protein [Flavobacterium sp. SM15]